MEKYTIPPEKPVEVKHPDKAEIVHKVKKQEETKQEIRARP